MLAHRLSGQQHGFLESTNANEAADCRRTQKRTRRESFLGAILRRQHPYETLRMSRPQLTTFEDFFSPSPLGCALCDMNGEYLRVNQAFADLIGYSMSQVLQLSYWEITPRKYERQEAIQLQKLSEGGAFGPNEKEFLHREGFLVPVSVSGWLVESDGQKLILSVAQARDARTQVAIQAAVG
jgi:PAS domain S-box-containing protein